ncbi:MAG: spore coat associated protein CotJA [Bacillota bacterium]
MNGYRKPLVWSKWPPDKRQTDPFDSSCDTTTGQPSESENTFAENTATVKMDADTSPGNTSKEEELTVPETSGDRGNDRLFPKKGGHPAENAPKPAEADNNVENDAASAACCPPVSPTHCPGGPDCPHVPPCPGYQDRELATAYIPYQIYGPIYNPREALERGTLFPALYRPYPC